MLVSKQVLDRLAQEKLSLRQEVERLKTAAKQGDRRAIQSSAEVLERRLKHHTDLVDAVIEAVTEDSVDSE